MSGWGSASLRLWSPPSCSPCTTLTSDTTLGLAICSGHDTAYSHDTWHDTWDYCLMTNWTGQQTLTASRRMGDLLRRLRLSMRCTLWKEYKEGNVLLPNQKLLEIAQGSGSAPQTGFLWVTLRSESATVTDYLCHSNLFSMRQVMFQLISCKRMCSAVAISCCQAFSFVHANSFFLKCLTSHLGADTMPFHTFQPKSSLQLQHLHRCHGQQLWFSVVEYGIWQSHP